MLEIHPSHLDIIFHNLNNSCCLLCRIGSGLRLMPLFPCTSATVRSHSTPDCINWCVGYLLLPHLQNLSCLEFKSSGCHQSMFPDASICSSTHLSGSSRGRHPSFVPLDFPAPRKSYRIYLLLLYCENMLSRQRNRFDFYKTESRILLLLSIYSLITRLLLQIMYITGKYFSWIQFLYFY